MSDLIRREQAIKSMQESEFGYTFEVDVAIGAVKALPTVEPERKKGRWIDVTERIGFPEFKCSVCQSKSGSLWMNFCPHCGADMTNENSYMKLEGTEHE